MPIATSSFEVCSLGDLRIEDQRAFRKEPLYLPLKHVLAADGYAFRVLPKTKARRWDRALLLNLTYWGTDGGGDILDTRSLPADVVCHIAWHHLCRKALAADESKSASPEALFLGESVASAFDVYLVGSLLRQGVASSFLDSQVPAMAEVTAAAGLSERGFEHLLQGLVRDPHAAFESVRTMLWDASHALYKAKTADAAHKVLSSFDAHPYGALLHRFELSNWVLYARAFGSTKTAVKQPSKAAGQPAGQPTQKGHGTAAKRVHTALTKAPSSLDWLLAQWLAPRHTAGAA